MRRSIYRAQWKPEGREDGLSVVVEASGARKLVESGEIMTAACYEWRNNLFLYYESVERRLLPEELLPGAAPFLTPWPGKQSRAYGCPWRMSFISTNRRKWSIGAARRRWSSGSAGWPI
ncbi:hypothetical protein N6H14_31785 [Paenibacillus sp. CC-CFT747]|nr:hypothetical protein N6H14_31785 [Paenibacillus sp. CC-CFT747]